MNVHFSHSLELRQFGLRIHGEQSPPRLWWAWETPKQTQTGHWIGSEQKTKQKLTYFPETYPTLKYFLQIFHPLFYFKWHFIARWKWPSFLILIVSFNIYKIYSFFPYLMKRIFKKTLLMQQFQHLLESNSCTISKTAHTKKKAKTVTKF